MGTWLGPCKHEANRESIQCHREHKATKTVAYFFKKRLPAPHARAIRPIESRLSGLSTPQASMASIITLPKPEQLTWMAPSMRRAKS
jgi:hypothetical protein